MNIYIIDVINLNNNIPYSYIVIADSVQQALIKFNGHDGADTDNQIIYVYSTMHTANTISYNKRNKLLAIVNGAISNNNAVKIISYT